VWFAWPTWQAILIGGALIVVGLGIRAAASGHIRKNAALATSGPYAYTRNPLYLGSIVISAGFIVAARNIWLGLAAAAVFAIIYLPVIRAEENYLRSAFPEYAEYAAQVPRLFPRPTPYQPGGPALTQFSRELYMRHREYNAILGSAVMLAALILKLVLVRH
jgi:protein-S-isoprenylcysteine O-methyltransferase Ste14